MILIKLCPWSKYVVINLVAINYRYTSGIYLIYRLSFLSKHIQLHKLKSTVNIYKERTVQSLLINKIVQIIQRIRCKSESSLSSSTYANPPGPSKQTMISLYGGFRISSEIIKRVFHLFQQTILPTKTTTSILKIIFLYQPRYSVLFWRILSR